MIYGGVGTSRFFPDRVVPKDPLVVFVGRVRPHKGVNNLIRAMPDGLTLEVIGRPYNYLEYQVMLAKLAVRKPVRFRSGRDDDEVIQAYVGPSVCHCLVSTGIVKGMKPESRNVLDKTSLKVWFAEWQVYACKLQVCPR